MEKIWLIVLREYFSRVRKKTFIIMSILGPLLIVAFYGVIFWSAANSGEDKNILVVDESELLIGKLKNDKNLKYSYSESSLDSAISNLSTSVYDVILFIPPLNIDDPKGIQIHSLQGISAPTELQIRKNIESELEQIKLQKAGIEPELLKEAKVKQRTLLIATIELQLDDENNTHILISE